MSSASTNPSPLPAAVSVFRAGLTCTVLATACCLATPAAAQSRGEMLYANHCSACHTSLMHWRDRKLVRDWPGLLAQVRYWQGQANLAWNDEDIGEVARYLDEAFYRLTPPPTPTVRGRPPAD